MPTMPTHKRGRKLVINWQEDAEVLRQLYRGEQDAEIKPRLHALWLLRSGHSMQQTAELVGSHYVTLQQWVAWYRAGGVAEVRRHKHGGRQGQPSRLNAEQIEQLNEYAAQGTFRTAQDVQEWLAASFGVHYRRGGIYSLLARLGWKPKTTRPQAMNAPLQEQEGWKKGD
jgi:transposase